MADTQIAPRPENLGTNTSPHPYELIQDSNEAINQIIAYLGASTISPLSEDLAVLSTKQFYTLLQDINVTINRIIDYTESSSTSTNTYAQPGYMTSGYAK